MMSDCVGKVDPLMPFESLNHVWLVVELLVTVFWRSFDLDVGDAFVVHDLYIK